MPLDLFVSYGKWPDHIAHNNSLQMQDARSCWDACNELKHSQQQLAAESSEAPLPVSPDGSSPAHRKQSERFKQLLWNNDFPKSHCCVSLDFSNWALQTLKGNDSPLLNPGRQGCFRGQNTKGSFKTEYFKQKSKKTNQTTKQHNNPKPTKQKPGYNPAFS